MLQRTCVAHSICVKPNLEVKKIPKAPLTLHTHLDIHFQLVHKDVSYTLHVNNASRT